ncbi:MAG: class I SAM-dependent methyltransferase [Verrucomicrobiia bacterium]
MNLTNEYKQQFAWRSWLRIFDALPSVRGQVVLDLGCAVGDQAAEFAARGARVIGVDIDQNLIEAARSRKLRNADFRQLDLRTLPDLGVVADGLWCSFVAAYFPELPPVLAAWSGNLRAGGWIALTEIDDLFGHQPLNARAKELLDGYAHKALVAKWYDFHMGHKLGDHLERSGFQVTKVLTVVDQELSFDGPEPTEVIEAWRKRFDRMTLLREFCGEEFETVCEEFLGCLSRADHQSLAKVYCCIASKRATGQARIHQTG